jgi:hypothetical protein
LRFLEVGDLGERHVLMGIHSFPDGERLVIEALDLGVDVVAVAFLR